MNKSRRVKQKKAAREKDEEVSGVIRTDDVSLRPKKSGSQQVGFRLPAEAIAYYDAESEASGRTKVDVVADALYLDRDLGRRLAPQRARLERAAASMGLSLDFDLAEVLSKLVEVGLAALESQSKTHTR